MPRGQAGGFPPEFAALIRRAFNEEVQIVLDTEALAINLRHRLNTYRRWLRENDAELSAMAEQIEFSLRPLKSDRDAHELTGVPLPPPQVIARPRGNQFIDALRSAGVDTEAPAESPESNVVPLANEPLSPLERALRRYEEQD